LFEERVKEHPAFANFFRQHSDRGRSADMARVIGGSGVATHEDEQVTQAGVSALA
jgi:hypothetical protein